MKKYLLGVIALGLAMGFSAFTIDFHGKRDMTYFEYTSTDANGYTSASNWQVITLPIQGCQGGHSTCVISSTEYTTPSELATYLQTIHTDPQVSGGDEYHIEDQQKQLEEQQ
jgi:hypothetical protein